MSRFGEKKPNANNKAPRFARRLKNHVPCKMNNQHKKKQIQSEIKSLLSEWNYNILKF